MSHRILLIDESAMLRRITANILHSQSGRYEVITATRAAEGFARACTGEVGLILLDFQVAGLADAELCRLLRAETRTSHIPLVLLVGQGVQPPALTPLPTNVVEVLSKPFTPEQITGLVNTVFDFVRKNLGLEEIRSNLHPPSSHGRRRGEPSFSSPSHGLAEEKPSRKVPDSTFSRGVPDVAEVAGNYFAGGHAIVKGIARTASVATTLRAVADRRVSGILRFWSEGGEPTEMVLDCGRVLAVTTRDAATYAVSAAQSLPAKVSQATLDNALSEQRASGAPFMLTLGTSGLLSKAAAVGLLRHFGQRHFARLWLQRGVMMNYELQQPDTLPTHVLRLEPAQESTDEWLLEAARLLRLDDVTPGLRHEGTVGTPFPHPDSEHILRNLALREDEQAFLAVADGHDSLPKIAESLKISQDTAYLQVFRFRSLDVLSYRPAPKAFVMTPRTSSHRILPLDR